MKLDEAGEVEEVMKFPHCSGFDVEGSFVLGQHSATIVAHEKWRCLRLGDILSPDKNLAKPEIS